MKSIPCLLFSAIFVTVSTVSAQADVDRVVEKTFTVHPGGNLQVSTQSGRIDVQTSNDGKVKVTAREHIHADSDSEADALLAKLTLTIEQQDSGVSAVAKYEDQPWGFHWDSWPPVQVDFLVVVPARYNVDLKTSGGGIEVADLDGTVLARTSGGSVALGHISGDVDARTSGGGMRLAAGGAKVRLTTSGGSIRVGQAAGPADLRTSGGSIEIDAAENTLLAHTSGGSVRATFVGSLKGDCSLSTSAGQIRVSVDAGAGFDLDAATSAGAVETRGLAVTIDSGVLNRSRLTGVVGAGGPMLRLRSSAGSIVVETHEAKVP